MQMTLFDKVIICMVPPRFWNFPHESSENLYLIQSELEAINI